MDLVKIELPREPLRVFCEHWHVRELSLFGSVLREDFRPDSDIDVLVSFEAEARIGLWDLAQMQIELESIFRRPVDLVEKEALQNPYRRKSILANREVVYAA